MRVRKMIAAVGVVGLAVAGCGDKVTGQPTGGPGTKAPETSETTEPSSEAPTTSKTAGGGGGGGTPSGTALALGQTATVPYNTGDIGDETTKLEITVVSVEKGSIADLEKKFELDAQTKASDPFYISVKVRNVGDKPTDPRSIIAVRFQPFNSGGDELGRLSLYGDFDKCDNDPPESIAVDAEYSGCVVYVAPAGQDVAKVVYEDFAGPNSNKEKVEITWGAA